MSADSEVQRLNLPRSCISIGLGNLDFQEAMASFSRSKSPIPPSHELDRIFQDFKQMLRTNPYQTPLQRANNQFTRQKSIELQQKTQFEAAQVFNLLPPGHSTNLSVDFWRALLDAEVNITLKIPVTLVNHKERIALLRTTASGQVGVRWYPDIESAFPALEAEVGKVPISRAYFPHYLHKSQHAPATLHVSGNTALVAWAEALDAPQKLQQFVQPLTKSRTLIRVHWKDGARAGTFYTLSTGPSKQTPSQSILSKIPILSRSYSEATYTIPVPSVTLSPNLVVQRILPIPDIEKSLPECVKLLNASLKPSQKVTEAVFDFAADHQRSWVFLSCKGYTFTTRGKVVTQTIEQQERIDINFLMYPVIARRGAVKKKINRPKHLGVLNNKRRMAFAVSMPKPIAMPHPLINTTFFPCSPVPEPLPRPPRPESVILSREVLRYESLVQGSRLYRESAKGSVDLIEKYGGTAVWRSLLAALHSGFCERKEIQKYFEEMTGVEQQHMIVNALLRVVRGDFNFYYKEASRRVHAKFTISKQDFTAFISAAERAMQDAGVLPSDCVVAISRFQQFEEYISNSPPTAAARHSVS